MAESDAFDPTQALDGWRAPTPAPIDLQLRSPRVADPQPAGTVIGLVKRVAEPAGFDPTQALDGWRAPAPEPPDLRLRVPRPVGLDDAKMTRLKARGYEMVDVEDIDVVDVRPASARVMRAEVPEAPEVPLPSDVVHEPEPVVDVQQPGVSTERQAPDDGLASPDASSAEADEAELALLDSGPQAAPPASPAPAVMEPAPVAESPPVVVQPLVEDAGVAAPFLHPPAHDIESLEPALTVPALVEAADPSNTPTMSEAAPVDAVDLAEAPAGVAASAVTEEVPDPSGEGVAQPEVECPRADAAMSALDFHVPPPPAAPDLQQMLRNIGLPHTPRPSAETDLRQILRSIELPGSPPPAALAQVPVIDIPAPPTEHDPRLLAHWQPHAWTALARCIAGASAEVVQAPDGMHVAQHAPQWLCALWPPQPPGAPMLGRWPERAALVTAEGATQALRSLLVELQPEAAMWQADLEADWGLVADLVLQQDAGLRPTQTQVLRQLAEAERQAMTARLRDGYALQGGVARRRT
ncbi:hypothetical protein [Roseateles sp.]|uniref:hypothetical protein n=1 Tax=Roseateles sp. TaxID=1971397 RepID=UPI003BAC05FF